MSIARTYLQPHYGNGVFGNVCLSAGQHPIAVMGVVDMFGLGLFDGSLAFTSLTNGGPSLIGRVHRYSNATSERLLLHCNFEEER